MVAICNDRRRENWLCDYDAIFLIYSARGQVTFDDTAVGKTINSPVPGRNYRYRTRYPVSATIKRDTDAIADEYDLQAVDDWPIKSLQVYCVVYELRSVESLPLLLQQLGADPRVESAQEMHRFESMTVAAEPYNDAYAQFQHGLESMSIAAAHKIANGKGVTIAVIDSGVDLQHEDFLGSDIRSRDFVPADRGAASEAHGPPALVLYNADNNDAALADVPPPPKQQQQQLPPSWWARTLSAHSVAGPHTSPLRSSSLELSRAHLS